MNKTEENHAENPFDKTKARPNMKRKMKSNITRSTAALITALLIAGCANEYEENIYQPSSTEVHLSVTGETPASKTALDAQYAVTWSDGDRIGLFYNTAEIQGEWKISDMTFKNGSNPNLPYRLSSASGAQTGSFAYETDTENSWPAMEYTGNFYWQPEAISATFHAYYPYAADMKGNTKADAYNFNLPSVQIQSGNDSKSHIATLDFMYASTTIDRGNEEYVTADLSFSFKHLFAILAYTVRNTTDQTITLNSVSMTTTAPIAGDLLIDLTSGTVTPGKKNDNGNIVTGISSTTVTTTLDTPLTISAYGEAVVYMIVNPADCSNSTFTVSSSLGNQTFQGGAEFIAGAYYTKNLEIDQSGTTPTYTVTTFDEVTLPGTGQTINAEDPEGFYSVSDIAGLGTSYSYYGYNDSPSLLLPYTYTSGTYESWSGFALSNHTDQITAGYGNQYSVYGKGGHSGANFAVGFVDFYNGVYPTLRLSDNSERVFDHIFVTNSTYCALSMAQGDGYAKKMNYEDKDWFKLTITGYDAENSAVGSIDFYLADFRTENARGIVDTWTKIDLSPLGPANKIVFELSSSDSGTWGMNTPAYFCLDDVAIRAAN